MITRAEELLSRLRNGELTLTELQRELASDTDQSPELIDVLEQAIASGELDPVSGRQLLAALSVTTRREVSIEHTQTRPVAGSTAPESSSESHLTRTRGSDLDPALPSPSDAVTASRLEVALTARHAATPTSHPEVMASLAPGVLLKERFLLKEQIGRGGMGVVFAAIDRRKTEANDPNPLVAVKVLNPDFSRHAQSFMALQREARKAQELAHPNVATVFDFDREGDKVFMTMELLQGRSLEAMVHEFRGRGVSRELALPIIRGVAEGLAYAHRKGIVHSDLKPANVFLTEDQAPKILDFGIARAMPAHLSMHKVKDTFDAGSLGAYTEAYATTEMMNGDDPHPSDDVYALGLIAYELLTGTHPYKRYSAHEARQHNLKPVTIKGLRRREWRVIERSLSFERSQRPQHAAAFLKDVTGITPLQRNLIAATLVLALATGFFGYRSYQESGPSIPFSQLPVATQQEFTEDMRQGDELWQFYIKDNNLLALQEAVEQYANAYVLHPRNRDAARALRQAADAALEATKTDAEQQRAFAKLLSERSDYLAKYDPVRTLL